MMWARNVWPYVNGKALMSGIRLEEEEASDMMDVIHFILEEDLTYSSRDLAESRSETRTSIYRELYGIEYQYEVKKPNPIADKLRAAATADGLIEDEYADIQPLNPRDAFEPSRERRPDVEIKPYVPPTEFDPRTGTFPGLDAPLG